MWIDDEEGCGGCDYAKGWEDWSSCASVVMVVCGSVLDGQVQC
jgi:hypothetical protein